MLISPLNGSFRYWLDTSAALAGVEEPLVILAIGWLRNHETLPRGLIFNEIERLAVQKESVLSMVIHSQVLDRHGRSDEAINMIEKVMERTYPTKNPSWANRVLSEVTPPWEWYATLKARAGDLEATNEIIRKAAVEYEDPVALRRYAQIAKVENNLELYEEYMNKAAMGGDAEACRKLANFYYLTFHGRFPRRGVNKETKEEEKNPKTPEEAYKLMYEPFSLSRISFWLSRIFQRSRSRGEYLMLAFYWYNTAALFPDHKAEVLFAILMRENRLDEVHGRHLGVDSIITENNTIYRLYEDQQIDLEYQHLRSAMTDENLRSFVKGLLLNWEDPKYEPKIPVKLKLLDT